MRFQNLRKRKLIDERNWRGDMVRSQHWRNKRWSYEGNQRGNTVRRRGNIVSRRSKRDRRSKRGRRSKGGRRGRRGRRRSDQRN